MCQNTSDYPVAYKIDKIHWKWCCSSMAFFICKSNSFTVLLPEPLQCFPNIDNSVGILWSDKDPRDNLSLRKRRGRLIFEGGCIIGGGRPGSMWCDGGSMTVIVPISCWTISLVSWMMNGIDAALLTLLPPPSTRKGLEILHRALPPPLCVPVINAHNQISHPPYMHTAIDQILVVRVAWERGYSPPTVPLWD